MHKGVCVANDRKITAKDSVENMRSKGNTFFFLFVEKVVVPDIRPNLKGNFYISPYYIIYDLYLKSYKITITKLIQKGSI